MQQKAVCSPGWCRRERMLITLISAAHLYRLLSLGMAGGSRKGNAMSRRFVLSTVGISLFSNILEISERPIWNGRLNLLSNTTTLPPDVVVKVDELRQRARARLHDSDVQ